METCLICCGPYGGNATALNATYCVTTSFNPMDSAALDAPVTFASHEACRADLSSASLPGISPQDRRKLRRFRLFGLNPRHLIIELLALSTLLAGCSYARVRFAELLDSLSAEVRLPRPMAKDPWPANVSVFASTRQDRDAFLAGGYTVQLLGNLKEEKYRSLKEAHLPLEKGLGGILRPLPQTPVSSSGSNGEGWVKGESRERFLIAVSGESTEGGEWWDSTGKARTPMLEKLAEDAVFGFSNVFKLGADRVLILHHPDNARLESAIKKFTAAARCPEESEILIYFVSHGERLGSRMGRTEATQGAATGALVNRHDQVLDEKELKTLVRNYLGNFRSVSLLIDSCESGAFIE